MRSPMLAFSLFAAVGPSIVAAAPSSPKLADDTFAHTKGTDVKLPQRFVLPRASPYLDLPIIGGTIGSAPPSHVIPFVLPAPPEQPDPQLYDSVKKPSTDRDDEVSGALSNGVPKEAAVADTSSTPTPSLPMLPAPIPNQEPTPTIKPNVVPSAPVAPGEPTYTTSSARTPTSPRPTTSTASSGSAIPSNVPGATTDGATDTATTATDDTTVEAGDEADSATGSDTPGETADEATEKATESTNKVANA